MLVSSSFPQIRTAANPRESFVRIGTLGVIYTDEIKHLAVGGRWFEFLCAKRGIDPVTTYQDVLAARFTGKPKPPFNLEARAQAGMSADYIRPWM